MKLSKAQHETLMAIVTEYDKANSNELRRWGKALQKGISIAGVRDYRTLFKLRDAGMIELETYGIESESLRKGSFGTRLGGTETRRDTGYSVKPTLAGRAYLNLPTEG